MLDADAAATPPMFSPLMLTPAYVAFVFAICRYRRYYALRPR